MQHFVYFSSHRLTEVAEPKKARRRIEFVKESNATLCEKNQTEDTSHSHFEPPAKSSPYRHDLRSTRNVATTWPSLRLIILTKPRDAAKSLGRRAQNG